MTAITLVHEQCHKLGISGPETEFFRSRAPEKIQVKDHSRRHESGTAPPLERFGAIVRAILPFAAVLDADMTSISALVIVVRLNRAILKGAKAAWLCNIAHF